eukprot:1160451-Pelagomonas_calceolata.AAC.12
MFGSHGEADLDCSELLSSDAQTLFVIILRLSVNNVHSKANLAAVAVFQCSCLGAEAGTAGATPCAACVQHLWAQCPHTCPMHAAMHAAMRTALHAAMNTVMQSAMHAAMHTAIHAAMHAAMLH